MVTRDSYWKMMKTGRFRAFRNLPVGWVLQILHSTDRTERLVRIAVELLLICGFWFLLRDISTLQNDVIRLLWVFVVVHTISWIFVGNFWVYMLDSFHWVKNPGINEVLKYIDFVRKLFAKSGSCDAILVYGSMSRGAFHGRSDLDLRIIRKPGLLNGLAAIFIGFVVRVPAAFQGNPVDLQVVDSLEFLDKQMRIDEHPIIVFLSPALAIKNPGLDFDQVLADPVQVLRDKPGQVS